MGQICQLTNLFLFVEVSLLEPSDLFAPIWASCHKAVISKILSGSSWFKLLCFHLILTVTYRFLKEVLKKTSQSDNRFVNFL